MSTTVLDEPQVDELYRTLEEKVRARRPNEDLSGLDRAYRFCDKGSQRADPRIRRALHLTSTRRSACARGHADGLGLSRDGSAS